MKRLGGTRATRSIRECRSGCLEARAAFDAIVETPDAHPRVRGDVRRYRLREFPAYSVFYRVRDGEILVLAVFHGKRGTTAWASRR